MNKIYQYLVVDVLLRLVTLVLPDPDPPMIKILERRPEM